MERYSRRTTKYSGQALAIAMVVLVVSSLIAISIYSRTMKDKGLTLEERASAEALEVSDVILNKLTLYPVQEVIKALVDIELVSGEDYNASLKEGIVLTEKTD